MKLHYIFVKYCFRYFLGFLIVLICCLPVANAAYNSIENYVIGENQSKLKEGVDEIQQNISKTDIIAQLMWQDTYFRQLSAAYGELPPEKFINLKYANQQLKNIGLIYAFAPYAFSLFRDNDLYISTNQCTDNFSSFYGNYLAIQDPSVISAETFRTELFLRESSKISFWKVESAQYFADGVYQTVQNAVLCIVNDRTNADHVLVFILRPEDFLKDILTKSSLQEGIVQIVNTRDGKILLNNYPGEEKLNDQKDNYHLMTYTISELGWEVTVGIPDTIISDQCVEIRSLILLYICLGIIFVLSLTFYFSYRQYKNVQQLFTKIPNSRQTIGTEKNEYDTLCRLLSDISKDWESYERQIDVLAQRNQAILLENLIVRGVHTHEEQQQFERLFQYPLDFFCVALLNMGTIDTEQTHLSVLCIEEYFRETYPYDFSNVHTGINNEIFLFSLNPSDAANVEKIRSLFEGIIPILQQDMEITFNVGISSIGTNITNINTCYNQAWQVVQAFHREKNGTIQVYSLDVNAAHENAVSLEFLEKIYNLLLCAEKEALHTRFEKLHSFYQKNPLQYEAQKQQIFFSIRNIIYSAYLQISPEISGNYSLPTYNNAYSVGEMTDLLEKSSDEFCNMIYENRKSRNVDLKNKILQYIKENYAIVSLTAAAISQEMGISEKYLSQFIKEQTSETVIGLLERTRIQAAMQYLTTTDMSNEKIAEATGFAAVNTFYRVFNKRTGVSPGIYRSKHIKEV